MRLQFSLRAVTIAVALLLPACGAPVTKGSPAREPAPAARGRADAASPPAVEAAPATAAAVQTPAGQATPAAPAQPPQKAPAAAAAGKSGAGDARASEVVRQARAALGGEAMLKEVRGFTLGGSFRRQGGGQEQSGRIELAALLPDKFKTTETMRLIADISLTMVRAVNGDQVWTDSRTGASNAQVMTVRKNNNAQQSQADQLRDMRAEFARMTLALFLTPPDGFPVQLTYAGEAEAGDVRADVLDAKGPDGFAARIFIDRKTHLPLMLSYRGVAFRTNMTRASGQSMSDVDKAVKEAKDKPTARRESEIQLHFSNYRDAGGVMLPHLITRTVDDQPYEEWEVSKFKLNPPELGPQKFVKN